MLDQRTKRESASMGCAETGAYGRVIEHEHVCAQAITPTPTAAAALLFIVLLAASFGLHAQEHGVHGHPGGFGPRPEHSHLDGRFSHNHYYHDRGLQMHGEPHGGYDIRRGRDHFYYSGGEWFRRRGGVSIVVGAPLGAFVPVLPPYYSTVWWGGVPYYYANDTYYTWDGDENQYEVVDPPDGIDSGGSTQPPPTDTMFVYPKNGQSADQQARDKYECHRSAVDATGFDPTTPEGGVPADVQANKHNDYMRADAACLEARGYSVT